LETADDLLSEGFVACALKEDMIVSVSHTSALTKSYVDIGVLTLEKYRGQGLATAAASLVSQKIQDTGQIPVWTTSQGNLTSVRVAEKLGFSEVSRSITIALDRREDNESK
jgi:predicted GNAT family acetyltransferase